MRFNGTFLVHHLNEYRAQLATAPNLCLIGLLKWLCLATDRYIFLAGGGSNNFDHYQVFPEPSIISHHNTSTLPETKIEPQK